MPKKFEGPTQPQEGKNSEGKIIKIPSVDQQLAIANAIYKRS